eukprot:TRINITY_DN143_c0_g4_i1.p2 TRINITY_DN143_c0_g4~~TRINITY_DN143_c0_g4_i1.p2  ORF type:complete len:104 (+),score=3.57 TRINITY_DN143_c0_g4_i1:3-314(+)
MLTPSTLFCRRTQQGVFSPSATLLSLRLSQGVSSAATAFRSLTSSRPQSLPSCLAQALARVESATAPIVLKMGGEVARLHAAPSDRCREPPRSFASLSGRTRT